MTSDSERRKFTRINADLACTVKVLGSPSKELHGIAKNVSYKGLFFVSDANDLALNDKCLVSLFLGDSNVTPVIEAKAEVVHHGPEGAGLLLVDVSYYSEEHLKNLVVFKAENPDQAEGEIKDNAS